MVPMKNPKNKILCPREEDAERIEVKSTTGDIYIPQQLPREARVPVTGRKKLGNQSVGGGVTSTHDSWAVHQRRLGRDGSDQKEGMLYACRCSGRKPARGRKEK